VSPLAHRIAIADACDCPEFRDTVTTSNSNTDAAIYYRKPHLEAITDALHLPTPSNPTCGDLRAAIRQYLHTATQPPTTDDSSAGGVAADGGLTYDGQSQLATDRFTFQELIALSDTIGVDPDTPYIESELRRLAGSSIAGPYLAELLDHAYVDLYLSINVGSPSATHGSRGYYPYRFEPVHEIPSDATSHPDCYRYVVDSSIQHDAYGNQDAVDTAARVDADAVVLADKYQDLDGTVDAVLEGLTLANNHEYGGDLIIPLQPPHAECYRQLRRHGIDPTHTFALGGLKDCNDDAEKLAAARAVRDAADHPIELHGLGFGVTPELARGIRDTPRLLDSIDYSTPAQSQIPDTEPGDKRLCTVAARAGADLIEDLRRVSPLVAVDTTQATQLSDH
jgi:hypothetical protein